MNREVWVVEEYISKMKLVKLYVLAILIIGGLIPFNQVKAARLSISPVTFELTGNPGDVLVNKLRIFRRHYKHMYYLILIVPSPFRDRIERNYPDIYDELYEDRDIPKMLYNIKNNVHSNQP